MGVRSAPYLDDNSASLSGAAPRWATQEQQRGSLLRILRAAGGLRTHDVSSRLGIDSRVGTIASGLGTIPRPLGSIAKRETFVATRETIVPERETIVPGRETIVPRHDTFVDRRRTCFATRESLVAGGSGSHA